MPDSIKYLHRVDCTRIISFRFLYSFRFGFRLCRYAEKPNSTPSSSTAKENWILGWIFTLGLDSRYSLAAKKRTISFIPQHFIHRENAENTLSSKRVAEREKKCGSCYCRLFFGQSISNLFEDLRWPQSSILT